MKDASKVGLVPEKTGGNRRIRQSVESNPDNGVRAQRTIAEKPKSVARDVLRDAFDRAWVRSALAIFPLPHRQGCRTQLTIPRAPIDTYYFATVFEQRFEYLRPVCRTVILGG